MYRALFALVAILSLNSTHLQAVEYGVGINIFGDGTIYMPVNIGENIRLEPYLSASKSTFKGGAQSTAFSSTFELNSFGLGLFQVRHISTNKNVTIGVNAAYLRGERVNFSSGTSIEDYNIRGYSIGPLLGFEYFPIPGLSIGGDVSWEYRKIIEHSQDNVNSDRSTTSSRTITKATIKYYFE